MICRVGFYVAVCCLLVGSGRAFVQPATLVQRCSGLHMTGGQWDASPFCRQYSILYSMPSEDDASATETHEPPVESSYEPAVTPEEPEGTQYPIDLPSPLLLASAMLSAIVSTGSAFQLTTDTVEPFLGVPITTALVFCGIPAGFFLLYAAILKGISETEEDDKVFLSGK